MTLQVNKKRMLEEFFELTGIDSVSYEEREMADRLTGKLTALGFDVREDGAAGIIGGNAGNLYGYLKGNAPGEPILLSAHMDTVQPGHGKKPVLDGGRIVSDGKTVLGADDVAGIVEILEAVRMIRENNLPHRDIEVFFSVAEEVFGKGAAVFNTDTIRSREAYVLDAGGHPGTAIVKAPTIISFTITVKGREAHAGFAPEKGIHAIRIAAEALSCIPYGRVGEDTTVNVGTIGGGLMRNIIPKECVVAGEIRSFVHEKACSQMAAVRAVFEEKAGKFGGSIDVGEEVCIMAYETQRDAGCACNFLNIAQKMGLQPSLTETFGGSDNNVFAERGIPGIVVSCGMENAHSVEEYVETEDLAQGALLTARLILQE